jgi:hypothetical protein
MNENPPQYKNTVIIIVFFGAVAGTPAAVGETENELLSFFMIFVTTHSPFKN